MLNTLLAGSILSLSLSLLSLGIGFCIASFLACLLYTNKKFLTKSINSFLYLSRGIPLLVQIFLLYYGAAEVEWLRNSILWPVLKEPFWCAIIILALNSSAYTTVILNKAIRSVPIGEIEACQNLNLTVFQTLRKVLLPQGYAAMWPAYSNEAIMILKSTSLVSTITLIDLMGAARQMIATDFNTTEILLITGCMYLILALILICLLNCVKYPKFVWRTFKKVKLHTSIF